MHQIHVIVIKYLTLLMLDKRKLESHQQLKLPTWANTKITYTQQNLKNESYNMMPKLNQVAYTKG